MPEDARMTGAISAETLGRRFIAASNGQLQRDLLKGVEGALRPVIPAIHQAAERLPRRGGLAAEVAAQGVAVRASPSRNSVSITIQGGMKSLADLDAGSVLHPVFDKSVWVRQPVTPGFFSQPVETRMPTVRPALEAVMDKTFKKLGEHL